MPTSSRDLLLIEDSEADRVLISAMLSEQTVASWQVETRSTLADGLALLRRPESMAQTILRAGDLELDPVSCTVTKGGKPLKLRPQV